MSENKMILKVYKMNWDFLLNNYLNPEMWQKTWTLFEYKKFKVTMNIYCIQTSDEKLYLQIKTEYNNTENFLYNYAIQLIGFSLKIDDITFLKRQINSAIFQTIVSIEKDYIKESEDYDRLNDLMRNEYDKLDNIITDFMDNADITDEDIRHACREAYIEKYAKLPSIMEDYISNNIYRHYTDFYLIWLDTLEDDPKKEIRIKEIKNKLNDTELTNVMKQIDEYKKYMETEQFDDEMKTKCTE